MYATCRRSMPALCKQHPAGRENHPRTRRTDRPETVPPAETTSIAVRHSGRSLYILPRTKHAGSQRRLLIDLDHLASAAETQDLRDRLFNDNFLLPYLAFVSPSGTGVKLFVPYRLYIDKTVKESFDMAMHTAWGYLLFKHDLQIYKSNTAVHASSAMTKRRE